MSAEPPAAGVASGTTGGVVGLLDAMAFSGLWVALAAVSLTAACATAFGAEASSALLGFAGGGTFSVYALDRLRDLARDRRTAPLRSAFVARHLSALSLVAATSALVAAGCALRLGGAAVAVAACAGGLGVLHRRLKAIPFVKGVYIAASWLAVTLVLPAWLAHPRPAAAAVAWAAAIVGPALLANAIGTSARDGEAAAAVLGARRALRVALGLALLGTLAGVVAPARRLLPVAIATAVALATARPGERYERVLDGALTLGALLSLL